MKLNLALVAVTTAILANPVNAASITSTSLSNFQISLIDLDLNDGITPSISFSPTGQSKTSVLAYNNGTFRPYKELHLTGNNNSIGTSSVTENYLTTTTATSVIDGDNFFNTSLLSSGSSTGINGTGEIMGIYSSIASDALAFTLSPFTSIKITADAQRNLETTVGYQIYLGHTGYEASGSRAYISAFNDSVKLDESSAYYQHFSAFLEGPFKLSELTTLSLMFDNASNSELKGVFNSYTEIFGLSSAVIQYVPIPSALPLMVSALGIFGVVAKRRKALKV